MMAIYFMHYNFVRIHQTLKDLQPLTPPDPLDPLVVDDPACLLQQPGNLAIAVAAVFAPGSPWENGYVESFNARLRDELLDAEIFYTVREAQIVIESWRRHFNTIRPHEKLGYKPPAPEVFVPAFAAWPAALRRPAPPATLPLVQRPTLN